MKVYLSADIEGTCGIADWRETERSTPDDYNYFQQQMTREVAAACEGALAGGADEIFVRDAHDTARNIIPDQLPRPVRLMRGWAGSPLSMLSGLEAGGFGAVAFTGCHAGAASAGSPLAHTMNLGNEYVTLNGVRASEFLINAYTAAYYKVPVVFLSGDRVLCDAARELIPAITTVAVNEGAGGAVVSMHPLEAVEEIRAGMKRAVQRADQCHLTLPERFETTVRFFKHPTAYTRSFYPGAWLEDEKNVCFSTDNWYEMLRFYHFVLSS